MHERITDGDAGTLTVRGVTLRSINQASATFLGLRDTMALLMGVKRTKVTARNLPSACPLPSVYQVVAQLRENIFILFLIGDCGCFQNAYLIGLKCELFKQKLFEKLGPDASQLLRAGKSWLTAASPVENPYCSCKLTRLRWRSDSSAHRTD